MPYFLLLITLLLLPISLKLIVRYEKSTLNLRASLLPIEFRMRVNFEATPISLQTEILLFNRFTLLLKRISIKKLLRKALQRKKSKKTRIFTIVTEYLKVKRLIIKTNIGFDDAALTACACGAVFGALSPIVLNAAEEKRLKLSVEPVWDRTFFCFFGEAVVTANPANIIAFAVELLGGKYGKASD